MWSSGVKKAFDVGGPSWIDFIYFWGSNEKQRSCDGQGGGRAAPRLGWQWAQKDGCAQRTGAHARPKPTSLSYIYLGSSVCHIPVCHPVIIAERSAILLVFVIKMTKETRLRVWRGRDMDGEIGKRQIREGGCEETYHCLSQTWETWTFTEPPAVALLN
jgi:hypothetical protein